MTWMQTAGGRAFDLLDPRVEDVYRADVTHALARIARFSGATKEPYSVLQHCILVMDILASWGAPDVVVREGGWHEVDEPYLGDLTRPLQVAVKAAHKEAIHNVLRSGFAEYLSDDDAYRLEQVLVATDPLAIVRARVGAVARQAFGLPPQEHPLVKRADNVALAIERRDLMAPCLLDWNLPEYAPRDISVGKIMTPYGAEAAFLARMEPLEARIEKEAEK